jgi:hypothetical protein
MYYKSYVMSVNEEGNIIETILTLMEQVECFVDKSGIEKKAGVMASVKMIIGPEAYERYEYFISSFIDFVVSMSKGKKLNLNNLKRKYCCF